MDEVLGGELHGRRCAGTRTRVGDRTSPSHGARESWICLSITRLLESALVNLGDEHAVSQLRAVYGPHMRGLDETKIKAVPGFKARPESFLLVSTQSASKRCDFDAGQHRHIAY